METTQYTNREKFDSALYESTFFHVASTEILNQNPLTQKFFAANQKNIQNIVKQFLGMNQIKFTHLINLSKNFITKVCKSNDPTKILDDIQRVFLKAHQEATIASTSLEKEEIHEELDPHNKHLRENGTFTDEINQFITETLANNTSGALLKNIKKIGGQHTHSGRHKNYELENKTTSIPGHGHSGKIAFGTRNGIIEQLLGENWREIYQSKANNERLKMLGYSVKTKR
jgi:hypothetical protein